MAKSCPICNFAFNPDQAERCQQCNNLLHASATIHPATRTSPEQTGSRPVANPLMTSSPSENNLHLNNRNQLRGKVTWMENAMENVDFNIYKFFTQLMLFFMFLPLLVFIFLFSTALWIAFSILGFRSISREVSPFNIANTLNSFGIMLAVIFPRIPQRNQVPVSRLTIQTDQGERPALIKGEMTSGTFRRGDEIELTGQWKRGTLIVESGFNRSLQTSIVVRRDYWMYAFFIILISVVCAGIYFLGRFPWFPPH